MMYTHIMWAVQRLAVIFFMILFSHVSTVNQYVFAAIMLYIIRSQNIAPYAKTRAHYNIK